MVVLLTKITTENHQSISFHFAYVYEGPISHRLLSPSLRRIFRKCINMLYSYSLIGTGCFPVPGTFFNVSNYNNSCQFITLCVCFSHMCFAHWNVQPYVFKCECIWINFFWLWLDTIVLVDWCSYLIDITIIDLICEVWSNSVTYCYNFLWRTH